MTSIGGGKFFLFDQLRYAGKKMNSYF